MVPVALAFDAVEVFLGRAWLFVTTPPWSYVAMAAAAALAIWLYGHHEYKRGVADCKATHAKLEHHETVRQVQVGKVATDNSNAQTGKHAEEHKSNKGTVRIIYEHDQALPDAAAVCVDPVDADRLRGIH